ncbi:MAG: hypothetical protein GC182_02985 [Rhodopseudomonas sp.]|nr:hypothetical protein [Rhodopseudomonas sp.]
MTIARATAFSIRTFTPAECSFACIIAPRLEMAGVDGVAFAQACLSYRCWRLIEKNLNNVMLAMSLGGMEITVELSKVEACMADDDLPAATGVRVASTAAGAPTIEFLDEDGKAFAVAEFTLDVFSHLIGECCDLVEIISKGGLATVACKGSA